MRRTRPRAGLGTLNIKSVEWQIRGRSLLDRGSRLLRFLGRRLAYTYEIVELSPYRLVMRTSEGPFPMETRYTWERVEEGRTLMTLRNRGAPTAFSRWVAPFMKMAIRRANQKDLVLLKKRLENE
jgi:hypothetical protein